MCVGGGGKGGGWSNVRVENLKKEKTPWKCQNWDRRKESYGSEKNMIGIYYPSPLPVSSQLNWAVQLLRPYRAFPLNLLQFFFATALIFPVHPPLTLLRSGYGLPHFWRKLRPQTSLYLRNGMASFISSKRILFPEQCINRRLMVVSITYWALVFLPLDIKF